MPTTVNGIGTRYVGKKNHTSEVSRCPHCHRDAWLSSYETGLWFVVLYVPIIPLGKKQVLNQCSACSTHSALPLKDWQELRQNAVRDSMEAVKQNADDPEAARNLLGTLEYFQQKEELFKVAKSFSEQYAADAAMQFFIAATLERTGGLEQAGSCFERAFKLEPDNISYRRAFGMVQAERGQLADAKTLLASFEPGAANYDRGVMLFVADKLQLHGEDEAALDIYRQLLAVEKDLGNNAEIRRTVKQLEKKLNVEHSILPSRSMFQSTAFKVTLALLVICGALFGWSYYVQTHRLLHVCNGMGVPLQVRIDGQEISVPPRSFVAHPIAEGAHSFEVTQPTVMQTNGPFQVSSSIWQRLFDKSAFILNPTRTAVIQWAEATYASRPEDSRVRNLFFFSKPYEQFDGLDLVFTDFPESVQIKNGRTETKKLVTMIPGEPEGLIAFMTNQVDGALLIDLAERHLEGGLGSKDLLRTYIQQLGLQSQFERGFHFLAKGLARRPIETEWHRLYQSMGQRTNRAFQIYDEYRQLADQNPTDSACLYLRGRIESDSHVATSFFEKSIAADSKNPYPQYAMCHMLRARGQFAEAKRAVEEALKNDPENHEMDEILFQLRLALGETQVLETELVTKLEAKPMSYQLHTALLMVLAAQGKLDQARSRQEVFAVRVKQAWPGDPFDLGTGSDRLMAYLDNDFARMLSLSQSIKQAKLREVLVFEAMIELGRFEELEHTRFADHAPQRGYQKLTMSLGFTLNQQADKATQWFDAAMADFRKGDAETQLIADAFLAESNADLVDKLDRISLQSDERVLVALAAAARVTDEHRATLLNWAKVANVLPNYPQKFVARVIKQLD